MRILATVIAASLSSLAPLAAGAIIVPPGFKATTIATGLAGIAAPTGLAITDDGTIFVAQQSGIVRVWQNGGVLPTPFIDLSAEVGFAWDRGLIGIAVDPDWANNHFVYLLYMVDPTFGPPEESPFAPAIGRVVRYAGSVASGGVVADPATRTVVLGEGPADGIPCCYASHSVGALRFGLDGTLFVSAGDGASFDFADDGGDPACAALFGAANDIGSFRSQRLDCLAGKILRIDPATGLGLASNPYFNGDPDAPRSKVWASGLRNPFRFAVAPDSPSPGTIYVGDVGWNLMEELSRVVGGENLGWPCYEGIPAAPQYPAMMPANSGCGTIGTPENPGPLTAPVLQWHHFSSGESVPSGITGGCAVGGVFQLDSRVPPTWRGLYYADYNSSWIRLFKPNAGGGLGTVTTFATLGERPVDLAVDPTTGDLVYVAFLTNKLVRVRWTPPDFDGNGKVDGADLGSLLGKWGSADPFADLNFDGTVDAADLGLLLAKWS